MSRYIDADALTWLVEEYKLAISPITEEQERDNRLPMQMLTEFENMIAEQPTVDAVPVDFINQKIVELQSCANQHFNDGNEMLATCVCETIRLLGSILKEWRGKEKR